MRTWLYLAASLAIGGCVTNHMTTQNAQIGPVGGGVPVARAVPATQARPQAPVLTPAARIASADLVTVRKTTTADARLLLASPQALARDCSPLGDVVVKVLEQPEHGTVQVEKGVAFPNYTPGDPPYLCNARRLPATLITYRAAAGYSGQDVTVVSVFFPDGKAPKIRFDIGVQ